MWLMLGPVLQPGKDTIVALDDPVLLDGERLHFSGGDGHAETDLQNTTTYKTKMPAILLSYLSYTLRGRVQLQSGTFF